MLKSVYIKNFILIDELELDFSPKLNVFTGETGSGKSIIIDAVILLMGERSSSNFVRRGTDKAIIEGIFTLPEDDGLKSIFEANDLDIDDDIIIRREIKSTGKSRSFINDTPVKSSFLKSIASFFADFHGQHDNQNIIRQDQHYKYLDSSSNYQNLIDKYKTHFSEYIRLRDKFRKFQSKKNELEDREDYLKFKLKEIEAINPNKDEDISLENELKVLEHSEELLFASSELYQDLSSKTDSAKNTIFEASRSLHFIVEFVPKFKPFIEELDSALISIEEIAAAVNDFSFDIEHDPDRIEKIRLRLLQLNGLKKRYGSLDDVIEKHRTYANELNSLGNFDSEISRMSKAIERKEIELGKIADELSKIRQKWAKQVDKKIEDKLHHLGVETASFKTDFKRFEGEVNQAAVVIENQRFKAFDNGIDEISFMISTNVGEEIKPLVSVASGGEVSRIMLAIKTIFAEKDNLPLLVFDEIDSGISGRIAQLVGKELKILADNHQIISITHLPQIASQADLNIRVEKFESEGRTTSIAQVLDENERLLEVAKLISGNKISDSALKSAKELFD